MSHINTQELNDTANLCQDPETKDFDIQAGQSWIYPTNYSVRDYQYNIIQEVLHKNTLVSLPTGLGKTFIAAVVMYNFYRWYPYGKVIFMAPTRPLVKQQMDACYNVTGISQDVTAELTGTKVQQSRTEIWQNKRVFFITPQVLQNDLAIIVELGSKIKCLVFDEAHKAKGNHAYCEVIRKLLPKNKLFRVLALSATPGNSSRDVIEVMQNLLIAHVEFKSEESPDVKPYVFDRALETVVVPLGEKLQQIKDQYIQVLEKYTRTLIQYKVIYGNCGNLTKGKIFMAMKDFQARNSGRTPHFGEIMRNLNICLTLYHAYETLIRCGLRTFLNFYEEHINNPLLRGNMALHQILEDLRNYLGPAGEVQALPDGTFGKLPASTKFGHPKFYKLQDILLTHFKNSDSSTRVIVFFEYRESTSEAYTLLSQSHPLIRPRVFVGQGSGVSQKDQINTVKAFREGTCNTLLSTCIGEEGLDVGEVDLIVCFDIANKSPIRMIQRMGRTGRKKEGRVVVLVTEGKEQQTLKECLIYKSNLGNFITNTDQLKEGKYANNPKMIPSYVQPKCQKMFITVKKPVVPKSGNLKDMLKKLAPDGPKFDEDLEVVEIEERIKSKVENFWNKEYPLQFDFEPSKNNFGKHLEKQRVFQDVGLVKHSKQTEIFVSLLQFADSKRYNIPVTQQCRIGDFNQNRFLKQGDIRSMFAKPPSNTLSQDTCLHSQIYNFDKEKDIAQSFPAELFEEISTFLSIGLTMKENCKTCDLLFECPKMHHQESEKIDLSSWVQPDLSILNDITLKDLEIFGDSLSPKSKEAYHDLLELDNQIFEDVSFGEMEQSKNKSLLYEAPRNFDKILKSFRITEDIEEDEIEEKSFKYEAPKSFAKVLNMMSEAADLKKNEEMSNSRRSELETIEENLELSINNKNEELLAFFKLYSFDDLFTTNQVEEADLDETVIYTQRSLQESPKKKVQPCEESPDLFPSSDEKQINIEEPNSPILCSYERVQTLQAKKKLFSEGRFEEIAKKPKLSNLKLQRKSFYESSKNKKSENCKKLDISDVCDLSSFLSTGTKSDLGKDEEKEAREMKNEAVAAIDKKKENEQVLMRKRDEDSDDLDISDVCDLSIFGLSAPDKSQTKEKGEIKTVNKEIAREAVKNKLEKELTIDDLCDIDEFFSETNDEKNIEENNEEKAETSKKNETYNLDDFCDFSFFMGTPKKETTEKHEENLVDLTDSPEKITEKENECNSKKNEEDLQSSFIDLTDSDLEPSPAKPKPTQTQLSITQMLSLIRKTNENSQKDSTSTSTPKSKTQKPSLSTKKQMQMKQKNESPKPSRKKINNTPRAKKKIFHISLSGNSEDEFEDTPRSPIFVKPRPKPVSNHKPVAKQVKKPAAVKSKKRKKLFSEFIEQEAEVSEDECVSDDENEEGQDCFEASFVADESQDLLNNTNMHAKYLQSVKSPRRGIFKIPQKFRHNIANVFSQEVDNEDNTYMNDTFCVDTEDVDTCDKNDLSELEILEKKLKEKKRSKKRKKSEDKVNPKRRRIIVCEDSD